jgi:hypothetical protein
LSFKNSTKAEEDVNIDSDEEADFSKMDLVSYNLLINSFEHVIFIFKKTKIKNREIKRDQ